MLSSKCLLCMKVPFMQPHLFPLQQDTISLEALTEKQAAA